jgi:hypothetical protein
MRVRYWISVFATFLIAQISAPGQTTLSFTDDFGDGIGHPGTFGIDGNWDDGDVVDGQTWIIPFDVDNFSQSAAARRDTGPQGFTGNNIAGRLRTLQQSGGTTNLALAAIDLTTELDVGTLTLSDFGDGTSRSGLNIRLLNSSGVVGLEIAVQNAVPFDHNISAFQVNAGTFITSGQDITWNFGVGANMVINFDARSDTFSVVATDTFFDGPVNLSETAFDTPIDRVARIELECFLAHDAAVQIGSEVSFESISLTGSNIVEEIEITQVAAANTTALEFLSQSNVVYGLDSTTDLVTSNNFMSTGAYTIGNGTNQFLFDPAGFSTNKAYRVQADPKEIRPL